MQNSSTSLTTKQMLPRLPCSTRTGESRKPTSWNCVPGAYHPAGEEALEWWTNCNITSLGHATQEKFSLILKKKQKTKTPKKQGMGEVEHGFQGTGRNLGWDSTFALNLPQAHSQIGRWWEKRNNISEKACPAKTFFLSRYTHTDGGTTKTRILGDSTTPCAPGKDSPTLGTGTKNFGLKDWKCFTDTSQIRARQISEQRVLWGFFSRCWLDIKTTSKEKKVEVWALFQRSQTEGQFAPPSSRTTICQAVYLATTYIKYLFTHLFAGRLVNRCCLGRACHCPQKIDHGFYKVKL